MKIRTAPLSFTTALVLALVALPGSGRAFAQASPAPGEGAATGGDTAATTPAPAAAAVTAPISATEATLHQGAIDVNGDLVIGLSSGNAGKPIQIIPNLYYGVRTS